MRSILTISHMNSDIKKLLHTCRLRGNSKMEAASSMLPCATATCSNCKPIFLLLA